MAGLAMAAFAHERLSQERRGLPAAIEARGRRWYAAGGGRQPGEGDVV